MSILMEFLNSISIEADVQQLWENHRKSLFKDIQKTQFAEFYGIFGNLPEFLRPGYEPTHRNYLMVGKQPPCFGKVNDIISTCRAPTQIRELHDALNAYDYDDASNKYTYIGALKAKAALTALEKHGGWAFLDLLQHLRFRLLTDVWILPYFNRHYHPKDSWEERHAMLTLQRMSWRFATYNRELVTARMQPGRRAVIDNQDDIFRGQEPGTRALALQILDFLMRGLIQRLRLGSRARVFIQRYCTYRRTHPAAASTMLDEDGIREFVRDFLLVYCLESVF